MHFAVDERQPGLLSEWVKEEGVRVGLKYGIASQWTSFVQADASSPPAQGPSAQQSPVPTRRLLAWFHGATRAREDAHLKRG